MSISLARLRHFSIFVGGGLLSAVVDIGVLKALLVAGATSPLAVAGGFLAGLIVNYLFHQNLTFKSRASLQKACRFLIVVGINYLMTLGFVYLSDNVMGLGVIVGKICSLPFVAANGFLLSKYWVFK
ncbi:GtrA family protein [Janthinobacterium sp. RT4P48]|uniref:GtrA family protein n=1 Tax=Janthinobacterium sp. RT4P48 TaxID=3424188 RepID=UPI003F27EF95